MIEKIKNKLKQNIINWLGLTNLQSTLASHNNDLVMLKSLVKCGVDVHLHQDHSSWAVICLSGKQEYVNFVRLDDKTVRDVRDFLRNFEKRNVHIDCPYPSMPREVFWR